MVSKILSTNVLGLFLKFTHKFTPRVNLKVLTQLVVSLVISACIGLGYSVKPVISLGSPTQILVLRAHLGGSDWGFQRHKKKVQKTVGHQRYDIVYLFD